MKLNLEKVFKMVRKNSGKALRYLAVIPALGNKNCSLRENLFMWGRRVWMPEASDILVEYRGKEFLVTNDFYGYDGDKNDKVAIGLFLNQFGSFVARPGKCSYVRIWFKELFDDGEEDIGGAGGAVAQVDGGGSGQLQCDQCGELPGSDPSSKEAIEELGGAFLQSEKAEEPAAGEAKS